MHKPLLDHIEVPRLSSGELMSKRTGERSATVRRTVADLEDAQGIEMHHVAEVINYHAFD